MIDYLGKAAICSQKAKIAIKDKKYDKAWGLLHKQKEYYALHSNQMRFNINQTLSLDSQVHVELANILRVEGKHREAFIHILYWVCSNNLNPIKKHDEKLKSYFNRCKIQSISLNDVIEYSRQLFDNPYQYTNACEQLNQWLEDEIKQSDK